MVVDDMGDAENISAAVMTDLAISDGWRDGGDASRRQWVVGRFENIQLGIVRWWIGFHKHTQEHDLSYFVVFSSTNAAIGSIGQSAYRASNMFLDSLVDHRVV